MLHYDILIFLPLLEQHHVVSRIESLFAKIDDEKEGLQSVKEEKCARAMVKLRYGGLMYGKPI